MNDINMITEKIIGLAITVHSKLGCGFLESVYQAALAYELEKNHIIFEKEKSMPVKYNGVYLDIGYRCDFLIENKVIVECKAVKELTPIDTAQLLNYLKISHLQAGLLINFNTLKLVTGIKRVVNDFEEK
jgi:GxxExxY protein